MSCLLSYTLSKPNPGELPDHLALSHLPHWPACVSTPSPPAAIGEDTTGPGRKEQHAQDAVQIDRQLWWRCSGSEIQRYLHWHMNLSGSFRLFHVFHLNCFIITFSFGITHTLPIITQSLSGTDNVTRFSLFHYDQLFCVLRKPLILLCPLCSKLASLFIFSLFQMNSPGCNSAIEKYAFKASTACWALRRVGQVLRGRAKSIIVYL